MSLRFVRLLNAAGFLASPIPMCLPVIESEAEGLRQIWTTTMTISTKSWTTRRTIWRTQTSFGDTDQIAPNVTKSLLMTSSRPCSKDKAQRASPKSAESMNSWRTKRFPSTSWEDGPNANRVAPASIGAVCPRTSGTSSWLRTSF